MHVVCLAEALLYIQLHHGGCGYQQVAFSRVLLLEIRVYDGFSKYLEGLVRRKTLWTFLQLRCTRFTKAHMIAVLELHHILV